jgi:hypothetical protein
MATTPFEPSRNDPNLRSDLHSDGTPVVTPGLDATEADDSPAEPNDPTAQEPTES